MHWLFLLGRYWLFLLVSDWLILLVLGWLFQADSNKIIKIKNESIKTTKKGGTLMTELRDLKGKLKAIWDPEENRLTIRARGIDVIFTLKSDGNYDVAETQVPKQLA